MSGRITDLALGGFGALGQAAGEGVEGYLAERDLNSLRMAEPPGRQAGAPDDAALEEKLRQLAEAGVSPQDAVRMIVQNRPGPSMPGAPQAQAPAGVGVRPVHQPSVVSRVIGPAENPFGELAQPQPQPQPQQQPQPQPQPQPAPQMQPQPLPQPQPQPAPLSGSRGALPEGEDAGAPLPYEPRPGPNRIGRVTAPVAPTPEPGPLADLGVYGRITPRNAALAQFMVQQQRAKEAARAQNAATLESIKQRYYATDTRAKTAAVGEEGKNTRFAAGEEGKNTRAEKNRETKMGIAELNAETQRQLGEVRNNTDVMKILLDHQDRKAKLLQEAKSDEERNAIRRAALGESERLLKVLNARYSAAQKMVSENRTPENMAEQARAKAAYDFALADIEGIMVEGGDPVKTKVPTLFGTKDKTTPGAASAKRVGSPGGAAPAPKPKTAADAKAELNKRLAAPKSSK